MVKQNGHKFVVSPFVVQTDSYTMNTVLICAAFVLSCFNMFPGIPQFFEISNIIGIAFSNFCILLPIALLMGRYVIKKSKSYTLELHDWGLEINQLGEEIFLRWSDIKLARITREGQGTLVTLSIRKGSKIRIPRLGESEDLVETLTKNLGSSRIIDDVTSRYRFIESPPIWFVAAGSLTAMTLVMWVGTNIMDRAIPLKNTSADLIILAFGVLLAVDGLLGMAGIDTFSFVKTYFHRESKRPGRMWCLAKVYLALTMIVLAVTP